MKDIRRFLYEHRVAAFVVIFAAAVFLVLLAYAAGSDLRELACNRLQDDSYYYLQPAWNFPRLGFFTFDGEHPTYGFQPLWMLILSLFSAVSPDKAFFLRLSVALGGFFYCLTGVALYALCRRFLTGWRAAIGPVLWLANPGLIAVFITAKENALYAFLFVVSCVLICRRLNSTVCGAWIEGAVLGLMVLARVNALVPAVLLLAVLFWMGKGNLPERGHRALTAAAGMIIILAVWGLYAQIAFGTVFPNSGSAKLIDSLAALAVFAEHIFPWIPKATLEGMVPEPARAFLGRPDLLTLPTRTLAISYGIGLLPDLAFRSWAGLFSFLGLLAYRLKLILLAAVGLGTAGWVLLQLRRNFPDEETRLRRGAAAVIGVVLLAAAANSLVNWLMMPAYLMWGVWYTVAEVLALLLGATILLGAVLERVAKFRARAGKILNGIALAAMGLLAVAGLAQVGSRWLPGEYIVAQDGTQQEAFTAAQWMNAHLPAGTRVGSFSAGLLGYFAETYRVINLDGLANTPEFVNDVLTGTVLYARGLTPDDPLLDYLRRENITYMANTDIVDRIDQGRYFGVIEPGHGTLLYEGRYPIFWGPGEPERRVIVMRIEP